MTKKSLPNNKSNNSSQGSDLSFNIFKFISQHKDKRKR